MKRAKALITKVKTLWLVTRTDEVGYDEYISCVVSALDEAGALILAYSLWKATATVECRPIGTTEEPTGIIHDSYLAG